MKKFLAILLAAMLLLSVGAVAVADEEKVASLKKNVSVVGDGASLPAETFAFTAACEKVENGAVGVTTGPAITLGTAVYTEGDSGEKDVAITLPDAAAFGGVGEYYYKIKETAGTTAGMDYDDNTYILKVAVVNGDNGGLKIAGSVLLKDTTKVKTDTITNTYSAGKLAISKTVAGDLADTGKYFAFKVKLEAPTGKTVNSTIVLSDTSYESQPSSIAIGTETIFYLKNDETLTFSNLPAGVTYTVTETADGRYTTTVNGAEDNTASGTIAANETSTAAYVNTVKATVDTGITTDSLPYVMLLGFVLLAGAALIIKRRVAHN